VGGCGGVKGWPSNRFHRLITLLPGVLPREARPGIPNTAALSGPHEFGLIDTVLAKLSAVAIRRTYRPRRIGGSAEDPIDSEPKIT
jgi:hypothetical protein